MSSASPAPYWIKSFSNTVNRELRRIHPVEQQRIRDAIDSLARNPLPVGSVQLYDSVYRIRVGNYRVIYLVDDRERLVEIGRVEHRGEATYRDIRRLF